MRLRAGTRGSDLALRQTAIVGSLLTAHHPGLTVAPFIIHSHGDLHPDELVNEDWPAGAFVSAIEQALLRGEIDFAVHSAKDLPGASASDLVIAAFPRREPAADVIILSAEDAKNVQNLESLAAAAPMRLGTGSPRRAMQMRSFGAFDIVPIRGNVPTRIRRIREGIDGVVLAAAGLLRLQLIEPQDLARSRSSLTLDGRVFAVFPLPLSRFPTSPGQGALAIQARASDRDVIELLAPLDDPPTRAAVTAEKTFLAAMSAGCRTAIAASARVNGSSINLHVQSAHPATGRLLSILIGGSDPTQLGTEAARRMRARQKGEIFTIWVTRDEPSDGPLSRALRAAGLSQLIVDPVVQRRALPAAATALLAVAPEDLVLFTSAYAAQVVAAPRTLLRVIAVGERTAQEARARGYDVIHVGDDDAESLLPVLRELASHRAVWHPCSLLSVPLTDSQLLDLRSIPVYDTMTRAYEPSSPEHVDLAIVTSPSAVAPLARLGIPLASIGETTSRAIRAAGLVPVVEAAQPTFESLAAAVADYANRSRHHFA